MMTSLDATLLARNIRSSRTQRGITQGRLAELGQLSQGDVSKLEAGKTKDPALTTLIKLAKALALSLDDLVCRDEDALSRRLADTANQFIEVQEQAFTPAKLNEKRGEWTRAAVSEIMQLVAAHGGQVMSGSMRSRMEALVTGHHGLARRIESQLEDDRSRGVLTAESLADRGFTFTGDDLVTAWESHPEDPKLPYAPASFSIAMDECPLAMYLSGERRAVLLMEPFPDGSGARIQQVHPISDVSSLQLESWLNPEPLSVIDDISEMLPPVSAASMLITGKASTGKTLLAAEQLLQTPHARTIVITDMEEPIIQAVEGQMQHVDVASKYFVDPAEHLGWLIEQTSRKRWGLPAQQVLVDSACIAPGKSAAAMEALNAYAQRYNAYVMLVVTTRDQISDSSTSVVEVIPSGLHDVAGMVLCLERDEHSDDPITIVDVEKNRYGKRGQFERNRPQQYALVTGQSAAQ